MKDWFDRVTSAVAYGMSLFGITVSKLSLEQWYFIGSIVIGVIALGLNFWHKRAIQRIAREQGISINEAN